MSSSNPFYYANTDLEAWVRLRICREFNDMGVRFAFGKPDVNTAGVHTDETRHYVLMYNLDNGGGHLKFWQEKGQPLERDGRYLVTDYSKLDLVETVETPNNRWYLINARVLHSVEGITSTRINVQVSLNNTVQIV
jgi:hypothetical protein